jgi:multidrug resistance efflux pump
LLGVNFGFEHRLIEELDTKAKILDLKLTRAKLKRQLKLQSIIEVSTAKDIAADQASVDKFQSSIEDSKRIAKTSGVVIYKRSPWERVKPKVGGVVYRGTEVLAIVDDKNLFVEAYLEEQYYSLVKKGDTLDIKVLGRREVNTTGVIKGISSIVLLVSDWDKGLPDGHAVLTKRAFKVLIDLKSIPGEAKPEGEVVITLQPPKNEMGGERAG